MSTFHQRLITAAYEKHRGIDFKHVIVRRGDLQELLIRFNQLEVADRTRRYHEQTSEEQKQTLPRCQGATNAGPT